MKTEIALRLISSGNLKKVEVQKLMEVHTHAEIIKAAFETGLFTNDEIRTIANTYKDNHVWLAAYHNLKNMDKALCLSLLEDASKDREYPLYNIIDDFFHFEEMTSTEAIEIAIYLTGLAKKPGGIWHRLLESHGFSKAELLFLGQIINDDSHLNIVLERLVVKEVSKKEILSLTKNKWVGKKMLIPVLKTGILKKDEMLVHLEKYIKFGINEGSCVYFKDLIHIYKLEKKLALRFARKINDKRVWKDFQESFSGYTELLTEAELIYLLKHGACEARIWIAKEIQPETLKKIAMKVDTYALGDIIMSGKIDKESALKAAEKVDWYSSWIDLVKSGLFSDYEILDIVTNKVRGNTSYVWRAVCEVIDLSIFSFDKLIEIGEKAGSDYTWSIIIKTLGKRK